MAHRWIGQEVLRFSAKAGRPTSLDALGALIDWVPAGRALAGLYTAAKGEKAWPPLAMFKALLLATWYDLSDVMLAEALADRASFRRFCGFASCEATPERTAFVRFRRLLVAHGLDQSLFAAIARDLERKGATVRKGTLIDATVIGSASKGDQEAAWAKHKSRAPAHGYKAHIAADKDTGIIREVETTPANGPMSRSRLRSSLGSPERFMPIAPMMRCRSKRPSSPRAERRGFCARAIAGYRPKRSKRIIVRCGRSGRELKKSSGPGSAAIIFVACDGWAWPRPNSKFISRSLLTISNAIGGCKAPEWIRAMAESKAI
jgi:Transposase domain (DUF772)/Transposase DDE domain